MVTLGNHPELFSDSN